MESSIPASEGWRRPSCSGGKTCHWIFFLSVTSWPNTKILRQIEIGDINNFHVALTNPKLAAPCHVDRQPRGPPHAPQGTEWEVCAKSLILKSISKQKSIRVPFPACYAMIASVLSSFLAYRDTPCAYFITSSWSTATLLDFFNDKIYICKLNGITRLILLPVVFTWLFHDFILPRLMPVSLSLVHVWSPLNLFCVGHPHARILLHLPVWADPWGQNYCWDLLSLFWNTPL